ncbi:MAG: hypothetical protein LBL23_07040 [Coriobacteriales bacterium]|jgi:uncharacterized OB-fold protein|nr:hypothetical protein [Coriobacteriales bacterium]
MEMYAYRCDNCGELHHPRHFVCRRCGHTEFTEEPLSGKGKVLTWTKVYNLPEGYMRPSLSFAIVRFEETGLPVSVQIDDEKPYIDEEVNSTVGVIKEAVGKDYYGFIVEPVVV